MKNRQLDDSDYDQLIETLKIKLDLLDEYKKIKESKMRRNQSSNLLDLKKSSINNSKQQLFDQSFNESITSSITQYTDQNDTQNLFKQTNIDVISGAASSGAISSSSGGVDGGGNNKIYQSSPIKYDETTRVTESINIETKQTEQKIEEPKTPVKSASVQESLNNQNEIQLDGDIRISKSDNLINIRIQSPAKISIETANVTSTAISEPSPTSVSDTGSGVSSSGSGSLNVTFKLLQKFNEQRQQELGNQVQYKLHLLKDILKNQFNVFNLQFDALNAEIIDLGSTINSIKSKRSN